MDQNRTARPTETAEDRHVLAALRRLEGRATLGDLMARTGLAQRDAEASLRRLLETRFGHLEVGEGGTLVYSFDPRLVRRDDEPLWSRIKRALWSGFKTAFKIWTLLMLVVYFVVFVVLLLAVLLAGQNRDQGGSGGGWGGGRGRGHHHGHFPSFWMWYLIWSPGWGWGRPYYGERYEERHARRGKREPGVPIYKKVFAFLFGPDRPRPTQAQKDRSLVRLIRARRGVVTAADVVQHTGLARHAAEEELGRLMVSYEGDVKVAEGELVYVFPELMVSAHGRVLERAPDPAWRRLEPPLPTTGNARGTDAVIAGVNGFNLLAAATAPWVIFPKLGFGGALAWTGLVWVPLTFSTLFFLIPLLRSWNVRRENAVRRDRNLRKVLLGHVYPASLAGDGAQPVTPAAAALHVRQALAKERVDASAVEAEILRLTAEFDAHVSAGDDGGARYRFDELRRQFHAAEAARRQLSLESREVGEIVYSSADTPEEASRRDLDAFDRELAKPALPPGGSLDSGVSTYLSPDPRIAYVDDFEIIAFEEEMRRKSAVGR